MDGGSVVNYLQFRHVLCHACSVGVVVTVIGVSREIFSSFVRCLLAKTLQKKGKEKVKNNTNIEDPITS